MIEFMDYVQNAFHSASAWDRDNSYSTLTAAANGLLDFQIPHGLRLHISSLSAPNFATSYSLASRGLVDGSVSFLYSSLPILLPSQSSQIDLRQLVRGYRHLAELRRRDETFWWWEQWSRGKRVDEKKDTLLYGRLYLPTSTLEALYLRRLSPSRLLRLTSVSDSALPNGGTMLAQMLSDCGKYSTEYLYSTDSSMLGARFLYNFGLDPRNSAVDSAGPTSAAPADPDPQVGRLSAGAEFYFSPLNKSGGMSTGVRFATLPRHTGFPYTMTLTCNPLMGSLSAAYAVKGGQHLSMCSRFDFNIYSYESEVQLGLELWKRKAEDVIAREQVAYARRLIRPEWKTTLSLEREALERRQEEEAAKRGAEDVDGVLKARVDQNWKIGVLWEGKIKELLISVGADVDLKRRERVLGTVGLALSYSS